MYIYSVVFCRSSFKQIHIKITFRNLESPAIKPI